MNVPGILLPGWFCPNCTAFNGDAKEFLQKCRCCEFDRPVSQAPNQDPSERVRALEGALHDLVPVLERIKRLL